MIAIHHAARLFEGGLQLDARRSFDGCEVLQIAFRDLEAPFGIVIAVEVNKRVRRVIVLGVELLELLIGQVGDASRVAARIDAIGVIGEERLLRVTAQQIIGRRVSALHLVEHNALEAKRLVGTFEFVMPAFLLEYLRRDARVEHRVEVNIDEVVEVLQVLAGDGVTRFVGVSEGIQEGVQRPLDEFDKRLLHRVLARPAQHRVFHDVRHTG